MPMPAMPPPVPPCCIPAAAACCCACFILSMKPMSGSPRVGGCGEPKPARLVSQPPCRGQLTPPHKLAPVLRGFLLACALLLAVPAAASAFSSSDLKGTWHGRLAQEGLPSFTVTSTIRSLHDAARNPVRYSGLDCTGTWAYVGAKSGHFRFREVITAGRSSECKGTGTVDL